MGIGGFFRGIGTLSLLAAVGLLIVTSVTSPTTNLSLLTIGDDSTSIDFGTFGYCVHRSTTQQSSSKTCQGPQVGYHPVDIIRSTFGDRVDVVGGDDGITDGATSRLTKVMILHPIAAGLAGIAALLSLSSGFGGSFLGTLVAALGFGASLAALVVDFVNFSAIRVAVNNNNDNATDVDADYEVGGWTLVAATGMLLIGTVLLFLTCCSGRRERRGYVPKASA